ncbi:hypothetical protein, partial [Neobacillus drentensis]|uniref:hypothetical protein n=1 Tax=Neobacillus drentensis TaxID=220684 RepID=UPI0030019B04
MIIENSSFFEIGFVKFVIILIIPYLKNLAEKSVSPYLPNIFTAMIPNALKKSRKKKQAIVHF